MTNELTNPKIKRKRRAYPDAYRQERMKLIRRTRPWEKSTGPKTETGKGHSARNALKHGFRGEAVAEIRRLLRLQKALLALCKRSITVVGSRSKHCTITENRL
jgi:hypothetical protein